MLTEAQLNGLARRYQERMRAERKALAVQIAIQVGKLFGGQDSD